MGRKVSREKFKVFEGVFDEYTLSTLQVLKQKGYFDELHHPLKTGKEADVYLASKGDGYVAVKIYRLTTANFKKISEYIRRDYRFHALQGHMRKVILRWTQKEFRNLHALHQAHIHVPFPLTFRNNVIVMDYLPGSMLKDTVLEEPEWFFSVLEEQLLLMHRDAQLIHGDLSAYNIMVVDGLPYIIDVGQTMAFRHEGDFSELSDLFERDVRTIVEHFTKRYGLEITEEALRKRIAPFSEEHEDDE